MSARTCDELFEEADGGEAGAAPLHGDLAATALDMDAAFSGLGLGLASLSGLLPAPAPMPRTRPMPMPMPRLWE